MTGCLIFNPSVPFYASVLFYNCLNFNPSVPFLPFSVLSTGGWTP